MVDFDNVYKLFPKAKKMAVENFTMGYSNINREVLLNLEKDRLLYKWNDDTVNAIIYILSEKK